jgi:hypothetical protein
VGAVAGYLFERGLKGKSFGEAAARLGVLVMSGFIVGESLFNVALAGLIVLTGNGEPLALGAGLPEHAGMIVSLVVGTAIVTFLYRWSRKAAANIG